MPSTPSSRSSTSPTSQAVRSRIGSSDTDRCPRTARFGSQYPESSQSKLVSKLNRSLSWPTSTAASVDIPLADLSPKVYLLEETRGVSSAPSDIIRRIRKPQYPIRVFKGQPSPLSLESQERIMKWVYLFDRWTPETVWLSEPAVELIKDTIRPYLAPLGYANYNVSVDLLDQGAFNRIYNITLHKPTLHQRKELIFRASLPIDPYYKVESDVATTEIVRHFTDIPVPIIYAFDSSMENPLGLEWILMEKIAGKSLFETRTSMKPNIQLYITKLIAGWTQQLASIQSNKIGSIYMRTAGRHVEFYVGRCVNHLFLLGQRRFSDVDRGPFASSQGYYSAVLDAADQEIQGLREEACRKAEKASSIAQTTPFLSNPLTPTAIEDLISQKAREIDEENEVWRRYREDGLDNDSAALVALQAALPLLCDRLPATSGSITTLLFHHDMSARNIIVNEAGYPIALLDWEMVNMEPLEFLTPFPVLLEGEDRSRPPSPLEIPDSRGRMTAEKIQEFIAAMEDRHKGEMSEYIASRLRPVYLEELKRIGSPLATWTVEYNDNYARELHERIVYFSGCAEEIPGWVKELTGVYLSYGDSDEDDGDGEEESKEGSKEGRVTLR